MTEQKKEPVKQTTNRWHNLGRKVAKIPKILQPMWIYQTICRFVFYMLYV